MLSYLPLILKNSLRNRRRTALAVTSVAASFCLLGVLLAMYQALFYGEETTPAQALRLITHHRVSLTQDLPVGYERKIEQIPGVRAVTKLRWFGGVYKDARDAKNQFAQFAIEPARVMEVHAEYKMPEEQSLSFARLKSACIVSSPLADKFGWKPGERITLVNATIPATLELTLAGIFADPDRTEVLYFNWDYLHETLPSGSPMRDMIQQYHVQAVSKEDVPRVAKRIDGMFENSPAPTKTENERAFQLSFVSFLGNLKLFLAAICGAVTFTILFVSANTISMSVRERTREIGVMKTLGFTNSAVLGIILGEAGLSAFAGGAIGCALAEALCLAVRQGTQFALFLRSLSVTPAVATFSLALALLIGVSSAVVPALSASRTTIIDSLRYSG